MAVAALRHFGGVDVLVNNAGIGATGHFAEVSPERLRKIMEVNFFALIETTRQFLPLLRQGTTPAIVNVSSIAGKRGIPARSEYSASKFAVQGFSEALRAELANDGIDVLLVCPGLTQTNFSHNMLEQKAGLQLDHLRGMTAEAVAEATLRRSRRGRHEVCLSLGGRLVVLVNRLFPRLADRIARRKVYNLFRAEISRVAWSSNNLRTWTLDVRVSCWRGGPVPIIAQHAIPGHRSRHGRREDHARAKDYSQWYLDIVKPRRAGGELRRARLHGHQAARLRHLGEDAARARPHVQGHRPRQRLFPAVHSQVVSRQGRGDGRGVRQGMRRRHASPAEGRSPARARSSIPRRSSKNR